MNISKRVTISTLLLATVLMAHEALAATYYVDRLLPGNDGFAGTTENAPFLTIVKCVAVAINPGDTCLVKNGTYPEAWRMTRSGASGSPITIANYPGHTPRIVMSGRTITTNQILLASTVSDATPIGWITIQGFEVTNGYAAFNCNDCHDVIFRQNTIHDMYMGGFGGGGIRLTIDRNRIYHCGRFAECAANPALCNQDQAVYLTGTYIKVTNNVIYGNLSYGIQVAGYPYNSTTAPGPEYRGADNWLIANNTIAYEGYVSAIVLWGAGGVCRNIRVENNIFYQNAGIAFQDCGGGNVIRNNLHYSTTPGNTAFIVNGTEGVTYTQSGNIVNTSNPNFLNAPSTMPASPNFQLNQGSPVIDRGLPQPLTIDFAGSPRPQGAGYDIGAYEGTGQSNAAAPSPPSGLKVF